MAGNQIVVRFLDGSAKKGHTNDFVPNKTSFHLNNTDGKTEEINIENIKAIFFVKDLTGTQGYKYNYKDNVPGGGKKIRVEFNDGEIIVGYVLGYSPKRQGFFMTPADLGGNNLRIYALSAAVKNTQFL
jgi:hypothetical protein